MVTLWRYCRLNNVTRPDRYPLPNLRDFTNNLKGYKVFSKLDLVKGYHQVPLDPLPPDVCKTAIVTPFGLFKFLSMPFGLKNAAQTFLVQNGLVLNLNKCKLRLNITATG